MDRLSLLVPKDTDQGKQKETNTTFMVTTYTCKPTIQLAISGFRETFTERLIFGHRRAPNYMRQSGTCQSTRARSQLEASDHEHDEGHQNVKPKTANTVRCYNVDTSREIHSSTIGRSYKSKSNETCKSSNLIYCLTCKICNSQTRN